MLRASAPLLSWHGIAVLRHGQLPTPSLASAGGAVEGHGDRARSPILAFLLAPAEVEGLRTDPAEVAPVRAGLAPLNTQGAAAAAAAAAIEQGAYDALPDSPGGGESTGAPHPLRPAGVHAYHMLHSWEVQRHDQDAQGPWSGLSVCACYTTTRFSQPQGRD